ncbi:signal peptidase I [Rhodococcus sp. IEGM 1408]|uniref:signal peptidase I n=1 Tax=Rhodococcus sp. IEGM 1408 TaxID=3082220 RepID=UPI003989352E
MPSTDLRGTTPPARGPGEPGAPARGVGKKGQPWYIEIPILVVIALVLVFVFQTFVGRVYQIPSESMEPTLHGCAGCTGDRIFVDKITYRFSDPEPGDVVVFEGPDSWNQNYQSIRSDNPVIRTLQNIGGVIGIVPPDQNDMVKRVIAVGGQTVGGCSPEGAILVDGQPLDEPYLNEDPTINRNPLNCGFGPITVPEGNYWVMGDNRNNSADSRFHMGDEFQGTVPDSNVIGKVQAIILPFSRIGTISTPDIHAG